MNSSMGSIDEEVIETKSVFTGKVISLDVATVRLPKGATATREHVRHPGAVTVLVLTDAQRAIFVRQYRFAMGGVSVELPAGKLEPGENHRDAAFRELKEETGYIASSLKHVHSFYTSPGFADEQIHLFEANGLKSGEASPDQDEFVETIELSRDEAMKWLNDGTIRDAKSIVGLYYWFAQKDAR